MGWLDTERYYRGENTHWHAGSPTRVLPRSVGIEIEIPDPPAVREHYVHVHTYAEKYLSEVKSDCTIPYCGAEITISPAYGTTMVSRIKELVDPLFQSGKYQEFHYECGTHVHVNTPSIHDGRGADFSSFRAGTGYNFVGGFRRVREFFDSVVPEYRRYNEWCRGNGAIGGHWNKTIEIRVFPSTLDSDLLVTYASLSAHFVQSVIDGEGLDNDSFEQYIPVSIRRKCEKLQRRFA